MAKTDLKTETSERAAPATPAKSGEFPVTLDNFCVELSQTDKRVELIGGFHYTERLAGRYRDVASAYRLRFQAFTTRAV